MNGFGVEFSDLNDLLDLGDGDLARFAHGQIEVLGSFPENQVPQPIRFPRYEDVGKRERVISQTLVNSKISSRTHPLNSEKYKTLEIFARSFAFRLAGKRFK